MVLGYFGVPYVLQKAGEFLVVQDPPEKSDAVVVLSTGIEYYPRLLEAATLYEQGMADYVVINGNRKTDVLRDLERQGFESCCEWDENYLRILELLGVPRDRVIRISAEDAFDTISEAQSVGQALRESRVRSLIVTTSRFHTRRARYIWSQLFAGTYSISTAVARADPFDASNWWTDGRQTRWVLAEYGGWVFVFWQRWLNPRGGGEFLGVRRADNVEVFA